MTTAIEVVNYAKNLANRGIGVNADGVYGTQCVDLPNYISHNYFGKWLWGNAIDLLNSAAANGYYVKYNAADDINPKAGDIFVMETQALYGHPYGHTGIVIEDSDGYTIKTIEQNIDGNVDSLEVGGPARYNTRNFDGIVGWFRFPYEEAETDYEINGWVEYNNRWTYRDSDGTPTNQWKKIKGVWYKFDENGYALSDQWVKDNGKWYWLNSDCATARGWNKINGKWYFFHEDGSMHEGWLEYYDKVYYLTANDGDMVSRECRNIDGDWYYFNENGERLERANITVDANGKIQF